MLNLTRSYTFASSGYLLTPYTGPRPCTSRAALLHSLQHALREESAACASGAAVAAVGDAGTTADGVLAALETHLHRCPDCGGYDADPSLSD